MSFLHAFHINLNAFQFEASEGSYGRRKGEERELQAILMATRLTRVNWILGSPQQTHSVLYPKPSHTKAFPPQTLSV